MTLRRAGGRAVALSNGVVAAGLVAVLAGVALVVNPPAPPGIAEFAPRATKPIAKAPLGQSAQLDGRSPGACGHAASCARSSRPTASPGSAGLPSPRPTGAPGTLQCYAWPDGSVTQTFDPQSPPCIASWDDGKGNGGATTKGVSASEIRVVVPKTNDRLTRAEQATVDFFNSRFMLYGRKIQLLPVNASEVYGPTGESTASGKKAAARKVISLGPFAALAQMLEPSAAPFVEELAGARVMSVTATVSEVTSTLQRRLAPYAWSYQQGVDLVQSNLAALACSALVGHKAIHGGPDVAGKTRKFAVILDRDDTVDTAPLTDGLAACGSPVRVVRINPRVPQDPATTQQFLQLKNDDYTSLITYTTGWSDFQASYATNAAYHPEWVVGGVGSQAFEGSAVSASQSQQLANAFGLGTWNKMRPWADEPWYRAPGAMGHQPAEQEVSPTLYHSLLVLASGIQMAGPRLTPESFAAGLQSTTFANPGAGAAPAWQASVGFGSGFSMVRDIALVWWNQNARDYSGSPSGDQGGGWCYLDRGRRFTIGTWPKGDPGMDKTATCS